MLDKLKKQLGITESTNIDMVELDNVKAQLASLQEQFAAKELEMADVVAKFDAVVAEKAATEEALATAIEHAQQLEAAAKDLADKQLADKLAKRKELIVATVGETKADATFEAVKALDDAAFDTVVSALALSVEKEAKSEMFTETGITAEVDETKVTMTAEERILREKYNIK